MIHAIHYILFHFVAITSKIFLILIYNVRVEGLENYKKSGEKALIICNHTSFIDALILFCFLPPGTSYAIDVVQFKTPKVRFLSKFIDLYPVNQNEPHSLKSMIKKLKEKESGHIVIFPEGRITTTGGLMKIYDGPSMIIEKTGAKLLPVFIKNAEHTVFSRIRHYTGIQFPIITLQIFEPELVEAPDTYTAKQKRQYFSNRIFDRMKDMKYQSSIKQASIIDSLEESAKIFGPKKEIISDTTDTHLTYKKLISYSKHLSVNIKRQHKEEKNIAILMPNSSATQLAYWSILYSGRTPAMLNINLGFKALLQCCKLANVKTVYTSRLYIHHLKAVPIIQNLSKNGIKIVYVESFRKEFTLKKIIVNKAIQIFSKPIKYKQNDDATILFTTSKRDLYKGVVLTHKNLISNVQQILTVWEINATDRMINVIPNSNSFGLVMGMIMPLMKGVFNYQHPNPLLSKTVAELCYQSSATVLIGTDSLLYRFGLVAHNYDFFNIRYVLCAGEKLRKQTNDLWMNKFGIRILEAYGSTEATCVISMNTPLENKPGTVGRILPGTSYYLDHSNTKDNASQLYLKGDSIVNTYITKSKDDNIKRVALSSKNGKEWLGTPDLVKIDNEGYLTIEGRLERFAKIAGQRIPLRSVEDFIYSLYPEGQHSVVHLKFKGREQLALLTTSENITKQELKLNCLKNGYAQTFVPHTIKTIKAIPIKSEGKINYSAIKDMFTNRDLK